MAFLINHKSRAIWETQITEGGGPISSPRVNRGEYDHRKAQRGQNAYGGGGRRVLSNADEGQSLDVPEIDDRIDSFKKRRKVTPSRAAKSAGLFAAIYGLARNLRK